MSHPAVNVVTNVTIVNGNPPTLKHGLDKHPNLDYQTLRCHECNVPWFQCLAKILDAFANQILWLGTVPWRCQWVHHSTQRSLQIPRMKAGSLRLVHNLIATLDPQAPWTDPLCTEVLRHWGVTLLRINTCNFLCG